MNYLNVERIMHQWMHEEMEAHRGRVLAKALAIHQGFHLPNLYNNKYWQCLHRLPQLYNYKVRLVFPVLGL